MEAEALIQVKGREVYQIISEIPRQPGRRDRSAEQAGGGGTFLSGVGREDTRSER